MDNLEKAISKKFKNLLSNVGEAGFSIFETVHMNSLPKVESLLQLKIVRHDKDFVDGKLIGEFARGTIPKFAKKQRTPYKKTLIFATSVTQILHTKHSAVFQLIHSFPKLKIKKDT